MASRRRRRGIEVSQIWAIVLVAVLAAGVAGLAAFALAPKSPPASVIRTDAPMVEQSAAPRLEPIRFAVVGDSNTEVNSIDFSAGNVGSGSWVRALFAEGFVFAGGWADGGADSARQAASLPELVDVDVLLIMTGTNDISYVDFTETTANIESMVAKTNPARAVLLAIPPRDRASTPTIDEFNAQLADLASSRGWAYFDGLDFLRAEGGGFVAGNTQDGVHLLPDASTQFGQNVLAYLRT